MDVSDKAKKCPHCGCILKEDKSKRTVIYIRSAIVAIVLIFGVVVGIQKYLQIKSINAYNESVYKTVLDFHKAVETVDEKIRNRNYSSLESLINTMKEPVQKFDELPINADSEYGVYINSIKTNIMYTAFKTQYIDSDAIDLDYGLTSGGYAYLITVYTEEILKVDFPETKK